VTKNEREARRNEACCLLAGVFICLFLSLFLNYFVKNVIGVGHLLLNINVNGLLKGFNLFFSMLIAGRCVKKCYDAKLSL
jgi:hypothetical protein